MIEVVEVVVMMGGGAWLVVDGSGAGSLDEELTTGGAELDDGVT